jgi:hypothetical protein
MQRTSANPQLKWAQRKDKVFITFDLVEVQDPKIDIVDGKLLKFSGSDKNHTYSLELELCEEISKEESKYVFASRNIFLNLKKKTKGPYWPRLTKNTGKFNFINIDWNLYIDEDDEEENTTQNPNFGNFGAEQSFPGFGDEMEDEDDLPEEEHKHLQSHGHDHDHDHDHEHGCGDKGKFRYLFKYNFVKILIKYSKEIFL